MFGYTAAQLTRIYTRQDEHCDRDLTLMARLRMGYDEVFPTNPNSDGFWIKGKVSLEQLKEEQQGWKDYWKRGNEFVSELVSADEVLEYYTHSGSRSTGGYVVFRKDEIVTLQRSCCMA